MDPNAAEKAGFTGMGFTGESSVQGDGDYDFSDDPLLGGEPEKKKGKGALVLIIVVGYASYFAARILFGGAAKYDLAVDLSMTFGAAISGIAAIFIADRVKLRPMGQIAVVVCGMFLALCLALHYLPCIIRDFV